MMRGHSVSVDPGESRRAALKQLVFDDGESGRVHPDPGESRRASLKHDDVVQVEHVPPLLIPANRAGPH